MTAADASPSRGSATLAVPRILGPVIAATVFFGGIVLVLATAGDTWGYDYRAYAGAAQRLLDGQPLYDPTVDVAGPFAIYLYPPPFALAVVPFVLLGPTLGLWAWTAMLIASLALAIALLPLETRWRWILLGMTGLFWPALYSIKLGQVGPLLLLLFVVGWRTLDRAWPLGSSIAAGALIKVQPGLLAGWAALTGRWRAAGAAIGLIALVAIGTLPLVGGLATWGDYLTLLGRVNDPVTTPHNFTPGAVLYGLGLSETAATVVQWGTVAVAFVIVVVAALRLSAPASFAIAVVGTQLASPLLWDHYAVVLLLPVAWLVAVGHRWAVAILVILSVPLIPITPPIAYPLSFLVCLVAPFLPSRSTT